MTLLVIDAGNLFRRVYEVHKSSREGLLRTSTGIPTSIIFGTLKAIEAFTSEHKVDKVIICHDIGGSAYRKDIFPAYKANRDHTGMESYFEECEDTRGYLDSFGIPQFVCEGTEADDSVGFFAMEAKRRGHKAIVFSDDKDFFQLKRKGIKIWRPCVGRFAANEDVIKAFRVKPKYIPYLIALTGDMKDNIPGLCPTNKDGIMQKVGFGPAKAEKILQPMIEEGKSFKWCLLNVPGDNNWFQYIMDNRKQIMASLKMARIRTKEEQYTKEEQKQLRKTMLTGTGVLERAKGLGPSRKTVIYYQKMLELNSIPIIKLLKRIGVEVR